MIGTHCIVRSADLRLCLSADRHAATLAEQRVGLKRLNKCMETPPADNCGAYGAGGNRQRTVYRWIGRFSSQLHTIIKGALCCFAEENRTILMR